MPVRTIATTPFEGQRPGTSGLRKKVPVFQQPHYLENFVQAVFDSLEGFRGQTLVVGGDGRYHNREAVQTILKMAAANGFGRVLVGRGGLLSTPAASAVIRKHQAFGGIILSASHNPGGPDGDFGIKYNVTNGGPAPEGVTEAIYRRTCEIHEYRILDVPDLTLERVGTTRLGEAVVEVIDPVADYRELMASLFDFERIRALFASGFRIRFDAMSAITGPYARAILEETLGAPAGSVINGEPLPDFGGHHPDPNPAHAKELIAADDGSGRARFRRRLGRRRRSQHDRRPRASTSRPQTASRSSPPTPIWRRATPVALLASRARCRPRRPRTGSPRRWASAATRRRRAGSSSAICSMPGSRPCAAKKASAPAPTTCARRTASGRSCSGSTSWPRGASRSPRSCATTGRATAATTIRATTTRRSTPTAAAGLMDDLRARLPDLPGERFGDLVVEQADDFSYTDPVDGSVSTQQGIRLLFAGGARIVYRLSGTGTAGATLRVYLERFEPDPARHDQDPQAALRPLIRLADQLAGIQSRTGRPEPSVIT